MIPTRTESSADDINFYELDYDDFESAMEEEDGGLSLTYLPTYLLTHLCIS